MNCHKEECYQSVLSVIGPRIVSYYDLKWLGVGGVDFHFSKRIYGLSEDQDSKLLGWVHDEHHLRMFDVTREW